MGKAAFHWLNRFWLQLVLAALWCCAVFQAHPTLDVDRRGAELGAPIERPDGPLASFLREPMLLPPEPIAPRPAFEDAFSIEQRITWDEPTNELLESLEIKLPDRSVPSTDPLVAKGPLPELEIWSTKFDVTPSTTALSTPAAFFEVRAEPARQTIWPVGVPVANRSQAPVMAPPQQCPQPPRTARMYGFVLEILRLPFARIRQHFQWPLPVYSTRCQFPSHGAW